MRSDRADGDPVEHFLEDGVAPSVIGGGPPESPFDLEPDPELPGRRAPAGPQHGLEPDRRSEPPTSPIPVVRGLPAQQEPEKRKSWLARMFGSPGR